MAIEVCSYRVSLRGKPVGSHTLRTQQRQRRILLEARLLLQGSLGQHSITQSSSLRADDLRSERFSEQSNDSSYELVFDQNQGLVRARQQRQGDLPDQAEVPYICAYQDPLGLLYQLRYMPAEQPRLRVPMLGKDVCVERLKNVHTDSVFGEREMQVLLLRPGSSYLYIDAEAPHYIMAMAQPLDNQMLETMLVKVSQEEGSLEPNPSGSTRPTARNQKRRRPRRRKGQRR